MSNTWDYVDPGYVADGYIWTGRPVICQYGDNRIELRGPSRRSGSLRLLQADKYSAGWERHGYPPIAAVSSMLLEYNQMRSDECDQLAAFQSAVDYSVATFDYIEGNTGYTVPAWFSNPNQTIEEKSFNLYTGKIELQSLQSFIPLPATPPADISAILANSAYPYTVDIRRAQPAAWTSSGTRRVVNKSAITRRTHTLSLIRKTATELGNLLSFFQNTAVGIKNTWPWLDARPVMREGTTNILLQSNNFVSSPWTVGGTGTSAQGAADPFGGTTAWTVNDTSAAAYYYYNQSVTVLPSTKYTLSLWIKKQIPMTNAALIQVGSGSYYNAIIFNPETGSFVTQTGQNPFDSTIIVSDGDFWRLCLTFTSLTGDTSKIIYFRPAANNNGSATPASSATGSQVFYGLQLEQKSYATSYVATGATTASRPDYPEPVTRTVRFAETSISWTQSSVRSDRYDLDIILEEDLR